MALSEESDLGDTSPLFITNPASKSVLSRVGFFVWLREERVRLNEDLCLDGVEPIWLTSKQDKIR